MTRKTHHVVPNPDGGWDVKKGGSERASRHFDRKEDAMNYGRKVSKNQGSEFIPHGRDGKFQNPDSHGGDPNPPTDKN